MKIFEKNWGQNYHKKKIQVTCVILFSKFDSWLNWYCVLISKCPQMLILPWNLRVGEQVSNIENLFSISVIFVNLCQKILPETSMYVDR